MTGTWFSTRKDIFLRDFILDFFDAKMYFDKISSTYKINSSIPFKMLDAWVGTESMMGPLWDLKNQSHRLFRKTTSKTSLYEPLFDWTMSSIFHVAMKLKEDVCQVDSYKPLLEIEVASRKNDMTLSRTIKEYFQLIEQSKKELDAELKNMDKLFSKAILHLREILLSHKNNILLLRLLLDNKKTVEKILGNNSFYEIFDKMFPKGIHEAYLAAAYACTEHGWYHDADKYLKKVFKADIKNKRAQKLAEKLQEKLSLDHSGEVGK